MFFHAFCDQSEFSTQSWALKHGCVDSENTATNQETQNCDPSYPDVCIAPYPPDLDCGQVPYTNFRVIGSDRHGFDSDDDGIGCER